MCVALQRGFCVCVVALSAAAHNCATAALTSMMPAVSPPSAPFGYHFRLPRVREGCRGMSYAHSVRDRACAEDVDDGIILCASCSSVRVCARARVCCAAAWHGWKRRLEEEILRPRGVGGSTRCRRVNTHDDTDMNTYDDSLAQHPSHPRSPSNDMRARWLRTCRHCGRRWRLRAGV